MTRFLRHKKALARIKWLFMDVDGVLTDGKIIVRDDGLENKNFHSRDGFAIHLGRQMGLQFAVISGRDTEAVRTRFTKQLRLDEVHLGKEHNKREVVEMLVAKYGISFEETAFVGDELIDAKAMERTGFSFCPCDAADEIRRIAMWQTKGKGGSGVMREIVMLILQAQGRYDEAVSRYL